MPGVQDVLFLSDNPFDGVRDRPCILVRLAPAGNGRPAREEIVQTIRTRLGEVVLDVSETKGPAALCRLDGKPMVEITANLAAGMTPTEARSLCESLAEEVRKELELPREYRLTWMQE